MNSILKSISAIIAVIALPAVAQAQCSSGFLANIACQAGVIDQNTARALDGAHAAAGNPLDHMANQAAGAAADYVAPGSGRFVTGALEMRRMSRGGPGFGGGNGQTFGDFCYTQAGRFGPGPVNPVGSFCTVNTPWGTIPGQVGR